MTDFLFYSIKTIAIQALFLTAYRFFLSKETFFTINRLYLLGSLLLSLIIPLLTISSSEIQTTQWVQLNNISILNTSQESIQSTESHYSLTEILVILKSTYFLGVLFSLVLFIKKIRAIYRTISLAKTESHQGTTIYRLSDSNDAFSFLNYIFIGDKQQDIQVLLAHEKTHQKKLHSVDILLLESVKIIFWFNPVLYYFQKKIVENHEFEADAIAIQNNRISYFKQIINQVFQVEDLALVSNFFNQSLIKKRIVMLQKTKSRKWSLLKYGVTVPMVIASVLLFANCSNETGQNQDAINAKKQQKNTTESTDDIKPIAIVDEIPKFKDCELASREEAMQCFNQQMNQHIKTHFVYPKEALANNIEDRVSIQFIIDENGNVSDIEAKSRNNNESLENEAVRIISLLPQFKPARLGGKSVKIKYGLPITFELQ
jgi:TonB family protein